MYIRCLILLVLFFSNAQCFGTILTCFSETVEIITKGNQFIGVYYVQFNSVFHRTLYYDTKITASDLMSTLMKRTLGSFAIYSKQLPPLKPLLQRRRFELDTLILWIEKYENDLFIKMLKTIKTYRVIGPETKILIYVENNVNSVVISDIFTNIWNHSRNLYSSVLVKEKNIVKFYAFNPPAGNVTWRQVTTWNGLFQNSTIFPILPRNFQGFKLFVAYRPRPPFIKCPEESGRPCSGSEVSLLETIAKYFNFSLAYVTSPPDEDPLVLIANGRYSGLSGMLIRFEADILIGGVTTLDRGLNALSPLLPYSIDQQLFVVPKPMKMSNWRSLYLALSFQIWLFIIAATFLFSFSLALADKSKMNTFAMFVKSFLCVIGCHFEIGMTFIQMRNYFKPILCYLFFYSIIITTCYKSSFTTLMTVLVEGKAPATLEAAYEAGLTFYFHLAYNRLINQSNHNLWNKILQPSHHVYTTNESLAYYKTAIEKTGVSLCYKSSLSFTFNAKFRDEGGVSLVTTLPERFLTFQLYAILGPGHCFYHIFQETLLILVEAGLPEYWLATMEFSASLGTKPPERDSVHELTLREMAVLFYILLALLLFNLSIFLSESILYKLLKK